MFKRTIKFYNIIIIIVLLLLAFYSDKITNNYTKTETKRTISEQASSFKVYFIDVGEADCILIDDNGTYTLIDGGNNDDGNKLVKYFNELGITKFKYVIGTHAHEDHIGGLDNIINNFTVEHFLMPDTTVNIKSYTDILKALQKKNILYETPKIDDEYTINQSQYKIFYIGNDREDLNENSIVLKLNYFNTSFLFTGDSPAYVEKTILSKDLKSDLLKVSHHGSQYSTSAQFLKKVNPKYAVISVGMNNDYGFPKDVTIKKLEYLDIEIHRTDKEGTIIVTSDGNELYFENQKTDTNG
ncbi:MAG: MBL fold metallo-hydrolase [Bacilli bacterium]|nr:MBL fold metallo-hydrolase [Bacilli bacterium]